MASLRAARYFAAVCRIVLGVFVLGPCVVVPSTSARTISNPVAAVGNDPWVTQKDGRYYYCYAGTNGIRVNSGERLEDAVQPRGQRVWAAPASGPASKHIWAPELHFLGGKWYIYFAADDGSNTHHRMFVLEGTTPDPTKPFVFKGSITTTPSTWAIDGTVLQHKGHLYFVWSGWPGDRNVEQDLYIAKMADPLTVVGERVRISAPTHAWEKRERPFVNEGPTALYHGDQVFIVYSASGSWADHYCLGLLTLTGSDPLEPSSWTKRETPVFAGTTAVISPGHASFVKSPDGTEDWIVYHAARHPGSGWSRNMRLQPFTWATDGSPDFGSPVTPGTPIPAPAGS